MDSRTPHSFSSNFTALLNSQEERNNPETFPPPPTVQTFLPLSPTFPHFSTQNFVENSPEEPREAREARVKGTAAEDIVLISAWLNTSKDAIIGNEQKAVAFWKRIAAYYATSPNVANLPKREVRNCKQRWRKINDTVCKFVGCYDHALSQRGSGQSDDDVLQAAYQLYENDHKIKFSLEHAWRALRYDQKWCSLHNSKGNESSKRTKLDDSGAFSSSSNTGGHVEEPRPLGVKEAKGKGKNTASKATNEEREANSRLKLESIWAITEKTLAVRQKLSREMLLDSLLQKTEPLSEDELSLKSKLINEML